MSGGGAPVLQGQWANRPGGMDGRAAPSADSSSSTQAQQQQQQASDVAPMTGMGMTQQLMRFPQGTPIHAQQQAQQGQSQQMKGNMGRGGVPTQQHQSGGTSMPSAMFAQRPVPPAQQQYFVPQPYIGGPFVGNMVPYGYYSNSGYSAQVTGSPVSNRPTSQGQSSSHISGHQRTLSGSASTAPPEKQRCVTIKDPNSNQTVSLSELAGHRTEKVKQSAPVAPVIEEKAPVVEKEVGDVAPVAAPVAVVVAVPSPTPTSSGIRIVDPTTNTTVSLTNTSESKSISTPEASITEVKAAVKETSAVSAPAPVVDTPKEIVEDDDDDDWEAVETKRKRDEEAVVEANESKEAELSSEVKTDKRTMSYLDLAYPEGSWSPNNPMGKKVYSKQFLLMFQDLCTSAPKGYKPVESMKGNFDDYGHGMSRSNSSRGSKSNLDILSAGASGHGVALGGKVGGYNVPYGTVNSGPSLLQYSGRNMSEPSMFRVPGVHSGSTGGIPRSQSGNRGNRGPQQHAQVRNVRPQVGAPTIPMDQVRPLEKSVDRWRPAAKGQAEESDEARVGRLVRAILNKLTMDKFDVLLNQMLKLGINTESTLKVAINLIFDKALDEPNFSPLYAKFCCDISTGIKLEPSQVPDDENIKRKRSPFAFFLLNRCQEEFELEKSSVEELDPDKEAAMTEIEVKMHALECEDQRLRAKRRVLGNIRFIGELFKLNMLTEKIMHQCIRSLFDRGDVDKGTGMDEEDIECLCKLMSTVGKLLDSKAHTRNKNSTHANAMQDYFISMAKLCDTAPTVRARFMLLDIIDMRENKWVPRRKENTAMTIKEVHQEAQEEQMRAHHQAKINRYEDRRVAGGRVVSGGNRGNIPQGDGWQMATRPNQKTKEQLRAAKLSRPGDSQQFRPCGTPGGFQSSKKIPPTEPSRKQDSGGRNQQRTIARSSQEKSGDVGLSEDALVKNVNNIFDEYFGSYSTKAAVENCIALTDHGREKFIELLMIRFVEADEKDQKWLRNLTKELITKKAMTPHDAIVGLKSSFASIQDISIDVPKAGTYAGMLLAEFVACGLPLRCVPSFLASCERTSVSSLCAASLLKEVYQSCKEVDHIYQFPLSDMIESSDNMQAYLKKHNMEWFAEKPLWQQLSMCKDQKEQQEFIFKTISKESLSDVSDLVTALLKTVTDQTILAKTAPSDAVFLKAAREKQRELIASFCPVLRKYLDNNTEYQLCALKAIQSFAHVKSFPEGLIPDWFAVLYNMDIVLEDTFKTWSSSEDTSDGYAYALEKSAHFLKYLEKSVEDDGRKSTPYSPIE